MCGKANKQQNETNDSGTQAKNDRSRRNIFQSILGGTTKYFVNFVIRNNGTNSRDPRAVSVSKKTGEDHTTL